MRVKTTLDITHRKLRKNAQSRQRAARLREKVESIKIKAEEEGLEEEDAKLFHSVEERRARKNNRSRERALEKKAEIERILAKPERERTKEEMECLEIANAAKKRKNEGDRLRREKLKTMGLKSKPPGVSIHSRPTSSPSSSSLAPPPPPPGMMGRMPPPPPPHAQHPPLQNGSETFRYPPHPAPHPHSYPPPNLYYSEPPPPPSSSMKEDEEEKDDDDDDDNNIDGSIDNHEIESNSDTRPNSANTDQEVSDLIM